MSPLPTGRGRSRDAWPDQIDHVALGAIAGLIATGLMTAVIAGGRALRLLNTPPPAQITANLAERAGVDPEEDHLAFRLVWLAAHGGYGVACGAGYVAARPILPRSTALAGLVYGSVIWGASYFGLMPALGLYPWPEDDTKSRLGVMMLAHVVFGVSLAEVERRLTHRS
jgi:uncharacterized membrane protein YagU involved in acid resistance